MHKNFRVEWILQPNKMTTHDACFSVCAVKDLFTDPLMEKGKVHRAFIGLGSNKQTYRSIFKYANRQRLQK